MKIILPCIVSFIVTAAITPLVIRLATAYKCLDTPGGRRLHKKITPRWGGLAFFAGVLPFLFIENGNGTLTSYILASCLLVGMGMVDDYSSLGWKTKFPVMALAATTVIFGGNMTIHRIGVFESMGLVKLDWLSIPFTYLGILGITNAINLLDGLNGLAGGVSLFGFLFMGIAALLTGNIVVAVICFTFVGALGAFLLYNFPNARIFMGDTGSLFLGFSLSFTAIQLTQDATSSVDAMFPVLVLLIPIFDTLRVMMTRLRNGKSPFKADTLHLHYLLVQYNFSPVNVTLLFWSFTAIFGVIALALTSATSALYLNVVLSATILLTLCSASLMQRIQKLAENRADTPVPDEIEAHASGFTGLVTISPGLAYKGRVRALKWIAGLGVALLTTQAFAGNASGIKSQDTYSTSGPPSGQNESNPGAEQALILRAMALGIK